MILLNNTCMFHPTANQSPMKIPFLRYYDVGGLATLKPSVIRRYFTGPPLLQFVLNYDRFKPERFFPLYTRIRVGADRTISIIDTVPWNMVYDDARQTLPLKQATEHEVKTSSCDKRSYRTSMLLLILTLCNCETFLPAGPLSEKTP